MDFGKLKALAKQLGGILVMQGNEPELVILPYEKYMEEPAKGIGGSASPNGGEAHLIDQLNSEISALQKEI